MNTNIGKVFAAVLVCAGVLLSACTSAEKQAPEPKTIQIALTQDMLSFDPMQTSDIFSEAILRCVYTSLYDFDGDLNLRPKLVKTQTVVDSHSWRIEIHDNVKFHDGSPLTADDVVFSIERARQGGRTKKLLEMMDSITKVNDTTVLIRTKEPYANFLSLFAKAETSIVSKAVVETPGYDFKVPVGAGPFKLRSREVNSNIRLDRFDDYYLEKAASARLNFVILVTEQERTAAFLNGDVDILFSASAYDCEKLRLSHHAKLLQTPSTKIEYLSLNTHFKPLSNPKVRQAISLAIKREGITNGVYRGYSVPAKGLIPEGIMGHKEPEVMHDLELARQLLKEAGYENGFAFTVITIDTIRKNTVEYIKLDLAEIGIQVDYNLVTMKDAASMMLAGKHESILVGWAFSPDPNSVLPLLLGTGSGKSMNSSNYSNPEVDVLLKRGREETDKEQKRKIYEQVNTIVTDDSPIVVLQNPKILSVARNTIEGIHFNRQGLIQYESLYRKE